MITLADAVQDLHRVAVIERKSTSGSRLNMLADLCIQELEVRGIGGAGKEISVPGIGRGKNWDVAWPVDGRVRLGISLKSLLKNIPGTVPNRADDLMGEVANVQLLSPEIVTGYLMIFETHTKLRKDGTRWVDFFKEIVERLSGRNAPAWAAGMVEAAAVIEVDFSHGPRLVQPQTLDGFFDRIAKRVRERNPDKFGE